MSKWKAWTKQDSYFGAGLAACIAMWAIPSSVPYAIRLLCGFAAGVVLLCWFLRRHARGAGMSAAPSSKRETPRSLLASVAGRALLCVLLIFELVVVSHAFGLMLWSWLVPGRSGPSHVGSTRGARALKWVGRLLATAQVALVAFGAYSTFSAGEPAPFSIEAFGAQAFGLVAAVLIDPICRRRFPIDGARRLTEYATVALPLRPVAKR
ncbi:MULTISPECIES: hypothetical protein [unclassified Dyella]|uniref:hypothetical protein n=1 Tax=Dyella sp. ASV21 TaxID=2795114 RepID=UPI0018EE1A4D|nr:MULTISPECIES: hypothetical protein [unclassified Dyella]